MSDLSLIGDIPGQPYAYWAPNKIVRLFTEFESTGSHGFHVRQGLGSSDNFRFLRLWWEVPPETIGKGASWMPYAKGGAYKPFWADLALIILWKEDGREIKTYSASLYGSWSKQITNTNYYFRKGLTYSSRTTSEISPRILPADSIFDTKGSSIFFMDDGNEIQQLLSLLAIIQSRDFRYMLKMCVAASAQAARSYSEAIVQSIPIPSIENLPDSLLDGVMKVIDIARYFESTDETSHLFLTPKCPKRSVRVSIEHNRELILEIQESVRDIVQSLDSSVSAAYGISHVDEKEISARVPITVLPFPEDMLTDGKSLCSTIVSYSVGVCFGRWDLRIATAIGKSPKSAGLFDPLPIGSPGMLTDVAGQPVTKATSDYPLRHSFDEILVDDEGHSADIIARVREVFGAIWERRADELYSETVEILGGKNDDLRLWFRKHFFDDHIKRYSKSRRKAPIYWCLATPSASYAVWLYYHLLTRDTFYKLLGDHITPKIQHEENKLNNLHREFGKNPTARERREVTNQEAFVQELQTFRKEIGFISPLWNPNLNDGVIINFAPLWRLVPQHRSWQKECKKVWDKLVKGDYDWAYLAMHLWPERVVPKCAKDRSLAIAHGLEGEFWYEDEDGKWRQREVPKEKVDVLIAERTSPAVKAALDELLSAPAPAKARKRAGRRGRGKKV